MSRLLQLSALSLQLLLVSACISVTEKTVTTTTKPDGTTITESSESKLNAVGGKGAHQKGVGTVWDAEKSLADLLKAGTSVALGWFALDGYKAAEATKQLATRASTKQAINANNNAAKVEIIKGRQALKAAEIEAAEAAAAVVPAPAP